MKTALCLQSQCHIWHDVIWACWWCFFVLFAVQCFHSGIAKVLRSFGIFFHELELASEKREKKLSPWGLVVHGKGKPELIGNILEADYWREILERVVIGSLCNVGGAKYWRNLLKWASSYILTFYLAYSDILSGILPGIYFDILSDSVSGIGQWAHETVMFSQ